MNQGMHLIELAAVTNGDREREFQRRLILTEVTAHARPSLGIRQRAGRRLIAVGERVAYGRSQIATR
jgi:hypothetical protein